MEEKNDEFGGDGGDDSIIKPPIYDHLRWLRSDPEESFCDWTIHIHTVTEEESLEPEEDDGVVGTNIAATSTDTSTDTDTTISVCGEDAFDNENEKNNSNRNNRDDGTYDSENNNDNDDIVMKKKQPQQQQKQVGQPPQQQQQQRTYHVHKSMMGVGAKQCGYFRRLFQHHENGGGGCFVESMTSTSTIPLDPIAADAFPVFLDYLYSPTHEVAMTTGNATALYHLGEYFECTSLCWEVMKFVNRDMTIDNCHVYYEHANRLMTEKILHTVAVMCRSRASDVHADSAIFSVTDPSFWYECVVRVRPGEQSEEKSQLIAAFLEHQTIHDRRVDHGYFEKVTDANLLPVIHFNVSKTFMELESMLVVGEETDTTAKHAAAAPPGNGGMTSLEERCVTAMVKGWRNLDTTSEEAKRFFKKQSSSVLAKMLLEGMELAKTKADEVDFASAGGRTLTRCYEDSDDEDDDDDSDSDDEDDDDDSDSDDDDNDDRESAEVIIPPYMPGMFHQDDSDSDEDEDDDDYV